MKSEMDQSAERTHPMTAKAGSSWRSKGKSRRKRVLKRAVMVSGEEGEEQEIGNLSACRPNYQTSLKQGDGDVLMVSIMSP